MARGGARPGAGAPKGERNGMVKRKNGIAKIPAPAKAKIAKPKMVEVVDPPEPVEKIAPDLLPLDHFLKVIRDPLESKDRRDRAAAVLLPFLHEKAGGVKGKKGEREEAAKNAATGRFAVPPAPRLVSSK